MRHRLGLAVVITLAAVLLSSCGNATADLGINWHGLLSQLIIFVLLVAILDLVGYKPIMKMLDERSRRVKDSMELADKIKADSARSEQTVKEQIEQSRREGQNIVAQAARIGDRVKEEARAEARKETEALIARARSEIQMERDEAFAELRKEFADVAIMAAEKVINKSLDKKTHQQLIEQVMEQAQKEKKK